MLTMLMRSQPRYVKEIVTYALRKSTTLRMFTTRLMSDQMSTLLTFVYAQAGGRDVRDQERLFEDVVEVKEHDDGSTRPRRSPKPNPRYSPHDYDLNCVSGKPRT
jgi:hypothetical protein